MQERVGEDGGRPSKGAKQQRRAEAASRPLIPKRRGRSVRFRAAQGCPSVMRVRVSSCKTPQRVRLIRQKRSP